MHGPLNVKFFIWIYGVCAYEKMKFLCYGNQRFHSWQSLHHLVPIAVHAHWLPSEIKIFLFNFSPNVQITSSAAYAQSANHLTFHICQHSTLPSSYLHQQDERGCQGNFKVTDSLPPIINLVYHTTAFITPSPAGREGLPGKLQSDRFPPPHNKFSVSHYNHIAYYFTFVHFRNHIYPSVLFSGKLRNERAHLFTKLSDLKLVHVMAAKTHLSDTILPFKLAEPNKNTSEYHE